MKYPVFNQQGKEAGQVLLSKEIFDLKMEPDLVYQVVTSQLSNRRQILAKAKTRGEVSGGGRKPWRQKGTGRARHGSIRSPLWKGGGVTFGPTTNRNFKRKINKKMRRKALFIILSAKAKNKSLLVLDDLKIEEPKTKLMMVIVNKIKSILIPEKEAKSTKKESLLLVLSKKDNNIIKASRNIAGVETMLAKDLNGLDLLSFKYLVMPEGALSVIEETFLREKS